MAKRFLTLALAAGTAIGIVGLAHAQGGQGKGGSTGQGASEFAPPHSPRNDPPGQGGQPPGQIMKDKKDDGGTTGRGPGASGVAPGQSDNPPPGQGGTPPGQKMNDRKNSGNR